MDPSDWFAPFSFIVFALMLASVVKILQIDEGSKWPYVIDAIVIAALAALSCYLYDKPYAVFVPFVTVVSLIGMWCFIGARRARHKTRDI